MLGPKLQGTGRLPCHPVCSGKKGELGELGVWLLPFVPSPTSHSLDCEHMSWVPCRGSESHPSPTIFTPLPRGTCFDLGNSHWSHLYGLECHAWVPRCTHNGWNPHLGFIPRLSTAREPCTLLCTTGSSLPSHPAISSELCQHSAERAAPVPRSPPHSGGP